MEEEYLKLIHTETLRERLKTNGYCHFTQAHFKFNDLGSSDWKLFRDSWNHLEIDNFLNDGGKYRMRRFGRYILDPTTGILGENNDMVFFQDTSVNSLNGGIMRYFAQLSEEIKNSEFLHKLVNLHFNLLPIREKDNPWLVNVHQVRTTSKMGMIGLPTPEGIHQDGHHFVVQNMIAKNNVEGGVSRIYENENTLLTEVLLENAFDCIIVDDQKVLHEVTPMSPKNEAEEATRDMLLLDFNPVS